MGKRKQRDPPSFMTALPHKGFVPMFNDQLNSPAFISLSTVAKVMYLILRHGIQRRLYWKQYYLSHIVPLS